MAGFSYMNCSLIQILALTLLLTAVAAVPIYSNCSGGSYAPNDTFGANLNSILSSLASAAASSHFANETSRASVTDRAFGLYICQGDRPLDECKACIAQAASDALTICPTRRVGILWYDYCMLRYSDRNFFGAMDSKGLIMYNRNQNVSAPARPLDFVSGLISQALLQRPLMFASNYSFRHQLFGMAQCTGDITSQNCSNCLNKGLEDIRRGFGGFEGWRFLAPSCSFRYESSSFLFNVNDTGVEIVKSECTKDELPDSRRESLDRLLSSLPAGAKATGFVNTTIQDVNGGSLYGLALCRADLAGGEDCEDCLNNAVEDVEFNCPNKTDAVIWEEKCMVRYSNESFFNVLTAPAQSTKIVMCNPTDISDADTTAAISMVNGLVNRASTSSSKFAGGEASLSNFTGYALVQCTRDLSNDNCAECLEQGVSNSMAACRNKKGWRYLAGSCSLRFEAYAFFNTSIITSETPASAPLPSSLAPGPAPENDQGSGSERPSRTNSLLKNVALLSFIFWVIFSK